MSAWARGPASRDGGSRMGGCTQPAKGSDFLHRCRVVLSAAAMIGVGIAGLDAQGAPATKRTETAGAPRIITPRASTTAQTQTQVAQPRKVTRLARRTRTERSERTGDRAGTDLGERLNKNTLVIVSGGLD